MLSDPAKRLDYDLTGNYEIDKYTLRVRSFVLHSLEINGTIIKYENKEKH